MVGLEGAVIQVEVDISAGLPAVTIVGLSDKAVQEPRERVRGHEERSPSICSHRTIGPRL